MLNPSSADEISNDPTVDRCQRRALAAGYGGLVVCNLFALRSTDPRELYRAARASDDPVGPDNNSAIIEAAREAALVVCGWGNHGRLMNRGQIVLDKLRQCGITPHALRITGEGQPSHPLYVPYSIEPMAMEGAA